MQHSRLVPELRAMSSTGHRYISTHNNHTLALTEVEHVRQYVEEEHQYQAIIGPFDRVPCSLHISPLLTMAKQDSDKKRTIMDLSWPPNL